MGLAAELLVVARDEVDAEGWCERIKWRRLAVRVGLCAVKQIAGDEDDVGCEPLRHGRDTPSEADAVDVAQVQVAEDKCRLATPGFGQIRQLDRDAANAD